MKGSSAEARLRRSLRVAAASVFAATPLELLFAEHIDSAIQLFPFVAAVLGGAGLVALRRPEGIRLARVLLVLVGLVAVLGMWEHVEHNYAFEREIRPNLGAGAVAWRALFGSSPVFAPGILLLGAFLAWASVRRATEP
jgi:hypothetical protein